MADNGNVIIKILADTSDFEKDLSRLKKGLVALGAAATAFGVTAVKAGTQLEFELTRASLAAGETIKNIKAGKGVFEQFRKAAVTATKDTSYTTNQAAGALTALAKAGLDAQTAIATLPAVLNMAEAGELELADAAESIVNIMSALGLSVTDVTATIDQMAKAADATTSDMSDIIQGMLRIGSMGKNAAGGTKELSAALAILRQNGIEAGAAGTSLRNIYTRLLGGNKQAAESFKQLGISTRDSAGNLRPLADIMQDLNVSLSKLSPDQKELYITQIFDVFNATSARNLMDNVDALRQLQSALDDAGGFAAEQAGAKADTLQGKLRALTKSYQDLGAAIFGEANPALKAGIDSLSEFLDELAESDQAKEFGEAIGNLVQNLTEMAKNIMPTLISATQTIASVVGILAQNLKGAVAGYVAYKTAALAAIVATKGFFAALQTGLVSTGIGAFFVALGVALNALINNWEIVSIRIEQAWIWLKKFFAGAETKKVLDDRLKALDQKLIDIKNNAKKAKDSLDNMGASDPDYNYAELAKNLDRYKKKVKELNAEIAKYKDQPVIGYAQIKSLQEESAEYQKLIDGINAYTQSLKNNSIELNNNAQTQSRWKFSLNLDAWDDLDNADIVERNQRIADEIQQTWSSAMVAVGDVFEQMTQDIIEGNNVFASALQGLIGNIADMLSQMGDSLIIEGTMLSVATALNPPAMIAAGIAAKIAAGAIKAAISRAKAGKYAEGGIVPGRSYSGDNVPAYVNSGELILNRAQQDNIARQLTANEGVNIQIINNAGADISVQQGSDVNEFLVLVDQRIDQFVASGRGVRAIKGAVSNNGY